MRRFLKIISNKYLLTLIVFSVIMIFFDQNDYFTQRDRTRELESSEQNIEFLKTEIAVMSKDLHDLKSDPKVLERQARERYYEKKADEDVFIIVNDTVLSTKQ